MDLITIVVPVYNVEKYISDCLDSLISQTYKNIEIILVDDGSTDNTCQLVEKWIREERNFSIRYIKKENGGKPRAINYGIQYAKGRFFFIVDSDDFLLPDAVTKMQYWCKEIESDPRYIGVGAARGLPDGAYIKGVAPNVNKKGYVDATNLQRDKYNLDADMCEAYKTDIFKKYPMAEWPGEKFAPEQIALNEIALDGYKVRWHADIIYICDYLNDGLTKGSRILEKNNPMGYAMMYNHMLKYPELNKRRKLYAACQFVALSLYGKYPPYILQCNNLASIIPAFFIGCILAVRRSWQYQEVDR